MRTHRLMVHKWLTPSYKLTFSLVKLGFSNFWHSTHLAIQVLQELVPVQEEGLHQVLHQVGRRPGQEGDWEGPQPGRQVLFVWPVIQVMIKLGSNFWALDAEPTSCSHTDTTHYWSVSSTYLPCLTNNSLCSDEEVLHHHQDHRPHPDEVVPPQVLHHDLHFLLFLLNDDPTLRTAWTARSYDYNLGWLTLFSTHIVISTRTYPLTLPHREHCP